MNRLTKAVHYFRQQPQTQKAALLCVSVIILYTFISIFYTLSTAITAFIFGSVVSLFFLAMLKHNKQVTTTTTKISKKQSSPNNQKITEASFNESMTILQSLAEQLLKEPLGSTKTTNKPAIPAMNCSVILSKHANNSFIIPHLNDSGHFDQSSLANTSRFLQKAGHAVQILKPKGTYLQNTFTQAHYAKWDSTSAAPALDFPSHLINLN